MIHGIQTGHTMRDHVAGIDYKVTETTLHTVSLVRVTESGERLGDVARRVKVLPGGPRTGNCVRIGGGFAHWQNPRYTPEEHAAFAAKYLAQIGK